MKTCTRCCELKDLLNFCKNSQSKDGLNSLCRLCKSIKDKEYRNKLDENKKLLMNLQRKEYSKIYRINNKDKIKNQQKIIYKTNKEDILKKSKDYYINNRDKRLLTNKEYNKTHKMERRINDKIRYRKDFLNSLIRSCKYIERKKKIICTIIKDDLIEMYNNQYKKCYYCKITMNTDIGDKICNQISIDRKDSNLGHTKDNCVLTCLFCNLAKNNTNIQHFKIFLDSIKKDNFNHQNIPHDNSWAQKIYNKISQRYKMTDITKQWIIEQYEKQNKKCFHSNINMIITTLPKYLFKPSIERLDCNKFYTKDNCVLVCLGINYGRLNTDLQLFLNHLHNIKNSS